MAASTSFKDVYERTDYGNDVQHSGKAKTFAFELPPQREACPAMKHNFFGRLNLKPATHQGQMIVMVVGILAGLMCVFHIVLGVKPIVVFLAGLAVLVSMYPIAIFGFLNIGAVLIALVGFRYVGFPLLAKLAMGQPLDTYLLDPSGSFGVVLLGVLGYLAAFLVASEFSVGRSFLQLSTNHQVLGRISLLSAVVGISANLVVAFRVNEQYYGVTIAEFFVSFLHLALISGIARAIQKSKGRQSVDAWVLVLFIAEIEFSMVLNSRMALMETVLCWIVTIIAFEAKIKWRHFLVTVFSIGMMVIFINPIFLYVRGFRGELSWNQRIEVTFETAANWPDALNYYMTWRDLSDRLGWHRSYYGSNQNVFERMSHINNVDILKCGTDLYGRLGIEDLQQSLERAMPRILAPNKPVDYSLGSWLYTNIGIADPGPYPTAPLIGTGYVAFGWAGAFFYPFILGLAWLIIVKKIAGWNLYKNIWAVYLLLRVHNQFVEGSSDTYMMHVLRILPQDFVLLWIVGVVAKGRFLHPRIRKAA